MLKNHCFCDQINPPCKPHRKPQNNYLMPHDLSMLLEWPNWDLLSKKLKYSMHFITYELKLLLFWRILKGGHVSHSCAYESCSCSLSTHYFKPNFPSFCFSTLIPNWYVLEKRKNSQKTVIISHKERIRPLSPLLFGIHRNSRTPDIKGITMGRRPIWGIHSLRFILSWFYLLNLQPRQSREKCPGEQVVILKTFQLHMTDVMNWWRADQRLGRGQG